MRSQVGTTEEVGGVTIVQLVNNNFRDEGVIDCVGNDLFELVDTDGKTLIVIDLKDVTNMSSGLFGKLMTLDKKLLAKQGQLRFCSMHPDIREGFRIVWGDKMHDVAEDRRWALYDMRPLIHLEEVNGVAVCVFADKRIENLDLYIRRLGDQLFALVGGQPRKIVLDYTGMRYQSAVMFGNLIELDKRVKAAKGRLRLCSICPDVYETFAITCLNKCFDIKENREKALEGMTA